MDRFKELRARIVRIDQELAAQRQVADEAQRRFPQDKATILEQLEKASIQQGNEVFGVSRIGQSLIEINDNILGGDGCVTNPKLVYKPPEFVHGVSSEFLGRNTSSYSFWNHARLDGLISLEYRKAVKFDVVFRFVSVSEASDGDYRALEELKGFFPTSIRGQILVRTEKAPGEFIDSYYGADFFIKYRREEDSIMSYRWAFASKSERQLDMYGPHYMWRENALDASLGDMVDRETCETLYGFIRERKARDPNFNFRLS